MDGSEIVNAVNDLKDYVTIYTTIIVGMVAFLTPVITACIGQPMLERRKARIEEEIIWGGIEVEVHYKGIIG